MGVSSATGDNDVLEVATSGLNASGGNQAGFSLRVTRRGAVDSFVEMTADSMRARIHRAPDGHVTVEGLDELRRNAQVTAVAKRFLADHRSLPHVETLEEATACLVRCEARANDPLFGCIDDLVGAEAQAEGIHPSETTPQADEAIIDMCAEMHP